MRGIERNCLLVFLFAVMSSLSPLASLAEAISIVDWKISTIDTGGVGQFSSIAVDSNNHVHISYYDTTNSSLKYASNDSGDWLTSTIDTGGVGQFSSIAVDSNNHVHISYYDATNSNLKYATNASGIWFTFTLDDTGDVGQFSSIAADSNNKVHISYYDSTNGNLKYASNASGDWLTSTIDSWGDVGQFSSIAVDSSNHVHISYYTFGYQFYAFGHLKYATNTTGDWVTSVIGFPTGVKLYTDSVGVGLYSSIAVDSNSSLHVSYYDGVNHSLQYTVISPSLVFWVGTPTIDATGYVGQFSSIAVDSNNNAHISYYDAINGNLKYAESKTSPPPCPNPSVVTLESPANGVTGISTTPTLSWMWRGTTHSVQVCSDSACNNVVSSASGLSIGYWTISPALDNNTQYWWRVKAENSCGNSSQWSGTRSFTTMTLRQSDKWNPKISVSPRSINMGRVRVGDTSDAKTVCLKNSGEEDLAISSVTISGTNQSEFSALANWLLIPAKSEGCPIIVTFSPAAPFGKKSALMNISLNDAKKTTLHVKLGGKGI